MSAVQERMTVTNLITVGTEQEAALIVAALEEAGIQADYAGDVTASFRLGIPGSVQINVHAEDLPRAQQILNELQATNQRAAGKGAQDHISTWLVFCKMLAVAILAVFAVAYVWHILG